MIGFQASEVIELPVEGVFRFVENLRNAPRWMTGVVRIEPLVEGPMRPGFRFKETRRMGKREMSSTIEVRIHDGPGPGRTPPYRHVAGSAMMGVDAVYDFQFHALDARRTKVEVVCEVTTKNLLGRLLARPMIKAMEKQDGNMLKKMKWAIEGESRWTDEIARLG